MISNFFSGFSLSNEKELFENYIIENDLTINGFSYGAIKAFESVLNSDKRVDLLQLFSPAFFQTQDKRFKRVQLMFFKKDATQYCNNFLENISFPSNKNMNKYFTQGTMEELDELINYTWEKEKLQALVNRGTKIEVYLGSEDKIIEAEKAVEFFKKYATVYFIKEASHTLQFKKDIDE